MKPFKIVSLLALLLGTGLGNRALAQWTTQTLTLAPGWNAVYLEVQPTPADPDLLFAGLPVDSVWAWNRRLGEPQFVEDVSTLVPREGEWLTHFPVGHPNRPLGNLLQVEGGRPLLIRLAGTLPVQWVVTGQPVLPRGEWVPNTPNLVGFHVSAASPPSISNFLHQSSGHVGTNVYSLNSSGRWSAANSSTSVESGRAYWVQTIGQSSFKGPLSVELEQGGGLDFASSAAERRLLLRNDSTNATRTFTLALAPSLDRPAGATNLPVRAGDVVLSYWDFSVSNGTNVQMQWQPLSQPLSLTLEAGREITVRLAVRRRDFAPSTAPAGVDASYQSLLIITDGVGSRVVVPVTARGAESSRSGALARNESVQGAETPARAGLWVGMVTVTNVSWVGAPSTNIIQANPKFDFGDRTTPRPTVSEFSFKVLLHLDSAGDVRLLQRVMEVWSNGTMVADTKNPGLTLPGTPGSLRLFTEERLAAGYIGTALRDGKPVARRISTPIFALRQPVLMTKTGSFGEGSVACSLLTGFDDNLNPFKHQYHPDHDNYNPGYSAKLPAGVESYDIRRNVRLDFSPHDPSGTASPGWLDDELGGVYTEAISGLHRETIHVLGSFRLRRASTVSTLN